MVCLSAEGEVGDGDIVHHDVELARSLRQTVPHLPPCMRNQAQLQASHMQRCSESLLQ